MVLVKGWRVLQLSFKSEVLALFFGALVAFLNFGDDHTSPLIGNLDTVFGLRLWHFVDFVVPLSSIVVFLVYGWVKRNGVLKLSVQTLLPLIVYLSVLFLISVDDVSDALNLGLTFPESYWIAMMWIYPIAAFLCFFWFGLASKR